MGNGLGLDIDGLVQIIDSIKKNPFAVQIIYNLLEQEPSKTLLEESQNKEMVIARVPHASGILDAEFFCKDKVFSSDDHRSHRRQKMDDEMVDK